MASAGSSTIYFFDSESDFQPVVHKCCNESRDMCYSVCGMLHIKDPLLLIGNSNP